MTDIEQHELDALSREIEELKGENDKLEQDLKGRVVAVKDLQEQIQTLTAVRDDQPQKPTVAEDAQIKDLEEQVQDLIVELTSVQTQIERLQQQLTLKDARYDALDKQLERLNERRSD